jgi:hypothetical protein
VGDGTAVARFVVVRSDTQGAGALAEAADRVAASLREQKAVRLAKRFVAMPFQNEPGRVYEPPMRAVVAFADDGAALARAWQCTAAFDDAVERFDVVAEPVRADGDGWGVTIPEERLAKLRSGDPILAVISARLAGDTRTAFEAASATAVAQAEADPAYLGGCRLEGSEDDVISLSMWSTAKAGRRYAHSGGAHQEAMQAAVEWVDLTSVFFSTFRVVEASGSLLGRDPFEGRGSFDNPS